MLGRWLWLFTRQLSMNDWNFLDLQTGVLSATALAARSHARASHHFFDLSLGAGFRGMRKSALIGCMSQRAEERQRKSEGEEKSQPAAALRRRSGGGGGHTYAALPLPSPPP